MKKIIFLFISFWILLSNFSQGQVSIVNIQLMPYNITPEALLTVSINNIGSSQQVQVISKLYNFNNELLVTVKSAMFGIKQGLNSPYDGSRKVASSEYSGNSQAEYIKTTHGLPSGAFKVCVSVIYANSSEIADEYCDEIESNFNQFLYLVYPADKDTIETSTPLLTWAHSEPFSILTQGEYYRMVVTEMKERQTAEEAVTVNSPIMMKNYLTAHSVQYPYDAKELQSGNHYAWQVQKIANGIITNKTEAWEFVVATPSVIQDYKYSSLQKQLDGGIYVANNNKVFFKFQEAYSSGKITCKIYDSKRKEILPKLNNEGMLGNSLNFKQNGYNRFEINLNDMEIKKGIYTLEVKNEKGELYLLRIQVL